MNQLQKSVYKWCQDISKFSKREAMETKISIKILNKIILNYFKISSKRVTDEEIKFLKDHSSDIIKIIPIIVMFPTPIPYMEILLILKGFGINILLPKEEDLKIPDNID